MPFSQGKTATGFTLAELLIALAILGVIATFTIPKIVSSQQTGTYSANAKEVMASISGAYQQLKHTTGITASTKSSDLLPYLNYVSTTTAPFDTAGGYTGSWNWCGGSNPCVTLHNGGTLYLPDSVSFGGLASTNYIYFYFDPDGKVTNSGTTNGNGKNLGLILYTDGRIATTADREPTDAVYDGGGIAHHTKDILPSWFSW
jgi:prepilin-type N-terminal cleavage/methylation domain-containing protein